MPLQKSSTNKMIVSHPMHWKLDWILKDVKVKGPAKIEALKTVSLIPIKCNPIVSLKLHFSILCSF